jgi:hypothetical protein
LCRGGGAGGAPAPTAVPSPVPTAVPSPAPAPSLLAILPILVSSELAKGPTRFLFALTDRGNQLVAAPDVAVHLLFYDVDAGRDTVAFEADGRFLWAIEGQRGLYVANVDFPSAGRWGTRFNATFPDGSIETVRADYDVLETTGTPAIGAPAPSVETPTVSGIGADLATVSSDPDPEPRFYQTSIAGALAAGEPFVVAFATPAFCQTATCGPTLETVKVVARDYPDLAFINVEPYVMEVREGSLQPVLSAEGQLQPAPWTTAWDLHTEPFIAVVDAVGLVRAKFEGVIAPDELVAAIEAL